MKHLFTFKISLLSFFIVFLWSGVFAQTQAGRKFVAKPIYIESFTTANPGSLSGQLLGASVYGGRFIQKDLALGAGIKSTQSIVSLIKNPTSTNSSFYGFARQYFKTPVRNLKAFGEAQLAFNMNYIPGMGGNVGDIGSATNLQNSLGVGLSPGVSYFLGSKVSADVFVSGIQLEASQIKNLQWQQILPKLSRVGVGISGTYYF